MAWHDAGWNGKICKDPAANAYCTGSHSLLSERIAREKRLSVEVEFAGKKLDSAMPEYLPPCFWSSCAFSEKATTIIHRHPFGTLRDKKLISESLPPNSIYTWPFRLSMTNSSRAKNGNYFPDLEARIKRYCERLEKGRSLIFFYLNYDNPVSADEYRYALVGCARLSDLALTGQFEFDDAELREMRSGNGMQNFPTLNWALRLTHEGAGNYVGLPYQAYLNHIAERPEEEAKLKEIRVLIEEPAIVPGFKYVSEQINDDHALALLYKLKRAFTAVEEHGIADTNGALEILDQFIEDTWKHRGLYPGLGAAVSILADLSEGDPQKENTAGHQLIEALGRANPRADLLELTIELLSGTVAPPSGLVDHKNTIRDARAGLTDHQHLLPILRKLSLFALTPRQLARILFPDIDVPYSFVSRDIDSTDIGRNPYLLAEGYMPATNQEKEASIDLDREQRTDGPIDYFTIDIGMFPDRRYIERNEDLQDLTVAGPQRLRAFAIEALRRSEANGHSFSPLEILVEEARNHPLFYRDRIALSNDQFLSDEHLAHFEQRLHVRRHERQCFFYLKETKDAEEIVARFVAQRVDLADHKVDVSWLDEYLDSEAAQLRKEIADFDIKAFKAERRQMMTGALRRPFYCVTGRPGSGKTQALSALLNHLEKKGETAAVLAPTGKAALRLNGILATNTQWKAETIDRWIHQSGLQNHLNGDLQLTKMTRSAGFQNADNIVIDEMSMVDLPHLALLFRALEVHQPGLLKRLILVGDENQLPPIGCGRPFHDIIGFLRQDAGREKSNLVRLTTNCRQQHDETVLRAAHLFAGKNRYHNELYEQILSGGQISRFLHVRYWDDANELQSQIEEFMRLVLDDETSTQDELPIEKRFNLMLGLYENGFVPNADARTLSLGRAQLIAPYRVGPSGALGLNQHVRNLVREHALAHQPSQDSVFVHSDKIIRLSNYYVRSRTEERNTLRLSNGSIGVLCNHRSNKGGRRAYFPECDDPLYWKWLREEDFELAYAITVHKAQGSEFQEALVVLPERRALLSRELVYTAMTRSKTKLTLLIQKAQHVNPLQVARERSELLFRNSSIFAMPFDSRFILEPEDGVRVKSKVEYLIYRELQQARMDGKLNFAYEQPMTLPISGKSVTVRPDFTVWCGNETYYWEHLGMLDRADYSRDWKARFRGYEETGDAERLVTTDDLGGIRAEKLKEVIAALIDQQVGGNPSSEFSLHHYSL